MSSSFKHFSMVSLAAVLLVVGGCGGDGKNASDNAISAARLVPSGGPGGGASLPSLPEVGAPLALSSDISGDVDSAKAVIDGDGNVTTVWTQSDGAHINLWSSRYNVRIGWSNALKLEVGALDVNSFQLVVDATGNVTVVWTQATAVSLPGPTRIDVERTDLWAVRYIANSGWGVEQRIESADLSASATQKIEDIGELQVGVDSRGAVTVLWTQYTGSGYDLYANRNVAESWDVTPTLLDSENLGDVATPQLLLNAAGNAFALWTQSDGTHLNLWGARYAAGWSAATKIDSEDGDVDPPTAVVDSSGAATLAWRQFDGNRWNLWRARYAGGWGAAAIAEELNGDVNAPQLLLYGTNNVMLFWSQSNGLVNKIWTSYYAGGWSANFDISNSSGDAGSVVMVIDSAGNITTAWQQQESTASTSVYSLWARRFATGSWESATLLETSASGDVRSPVLFMDSARRPSVIWLQEQDGRFDLWSNHYALGSWGGAQLVEQMDDGSAVDPQAVMSSSDNIALFWRTPYDSSNQLVSSQYTAGSNAGWGAVAKVESPLNNNGYNPIPLVDGNGMVTVVWLQPVTDTNGNRVELWGSYF